MLALGSPELRWLFGLRRLTPPSPLAFNISSGCRTSACALDGVDCALLREDDVVISYL